MISTSSMVKWTTFCHSKRFTTKSKAALFPVLASLCFYPCQLFFWIGDINICFTPRRLFPFLEYETQLLNFVTFKLNLTLKHCLHQQSQELLALLKFHPQPYKDGMQSQPDLEIFSFTRNVFSINSLSISCTSPPTWNMTYFYFQERHSQSTNSSHCNRHKELLH